MKSAHVTRMSRTSVGLLLLVLGLAPIADAKTVTPSGQAAHGATVRAEPNADSHAVGTLAPRQRAEVLEDVPRWWKVRLADGTTGFVSKAATVVTNGATAGDTGTGGTNESNGPGVPGWDTYAGLPKCTRADCDFEVLPNEDFTVGYSETRKDPLWVAYHLFRVDNPQRDARPSFHTDTRTRARVATRCYANSGFDRGHNAPNYAIDTRYGADAQNDTFLMSNISPQAPCLNEETWEAFEKVEANDYANAFGNIWTITGPIFDAQPAGIDCDVQIPKAFYKIIVRDDHGLPAAVAVEMSQDVRGSQPLRGLVTTVKSIEEETGFDFFPDLAADAKSALETATADSQWNIDQTLVPSLKCRLGP